MTNYSQLTCGRRYQISRWLVTLASIQTRYVLAGHARAVFAHRVLPLNSCVELVVIACLRDREQ